MGKYLTIEDIKAQKDKYNMLSIEEQQFFDASVDFRLKENNIQIPTSDMNQNAYNSAEKYAETVTRKKGDLHTALPSERLQIKIMEAYKRASNGDEGARNEITKLEALRDMFLEPIQAEAPNLQTAGKEDKEDYTKLSITDKLALALRNGFTTSADMALHVPKMIFMDEKQRRKEMQLQAQNMITPRSDFENPVARTIADSWYQITSMVPPLVTSYIAASSTILGAAYLGASEGASAIAGHVATGFSWYSTSAESLHGEMLAEGFEDNATTMATAEVTSVAIGITEALQLDMFSKTSKDIIKKISMEKLKQDLKKTMLQKSVSAGKSFLIGGSKNTGVEMIQNAMEMTSKLIADQLGDTEITNFDEQWGQFKDEAIPTATTIFMMEALGIPVSKINMLLGNSKSKQDMKELENLINMMEETKIQAVEDVIRTGAVAEIIPVEQRTEDQKYALELLEKNTSEGVVDGNAMFEQMITDLVMKEAEKSDSIVKKEELTKEKDRVISLVENKEDSGDDIELDPQDSILNLNKANTEYLEETLGRVPPDSRPEQKRGHIDLMIQALDEGHVKNAKLLAEKLKSGEINKVSAAEQTGLGMRYKEVQSEMRDVGEILTDLDKDTQEYAQWEQEYNDLSDELRLLGEAGRISGRELSDAFRSMQNTFNDPYSTDKKIKEIEDFTGEGMTVEEKVFIDDKLYQMKVQKEKINNAEAETQSIKRKNNKAKRKKTINEQIPELIQKLNSLTETHDEDGIISKQASSIINKLSDLYVEGGIIDSSSGKTIAENMVDQIKQDADWLNNEDLWNALGSRFKGETKIPSDIKKKKAEIRKINKRMGDISDFLNDIINNPEKTEIEKSEAVKELDRKLKILKKEINSSKIHKNAIDGLNKTLDDLQRQLNDEFRHIPDVKVEIPKDIQDIKDKITLTKAEIKAYDEMITIFEELQGRSRLPSEKRKKITSEKLEMYRSNIKTMKDTIKKYKNNLNRDLNKDQKTLDRLNAIIESLDRQISQGVKDVKKDIALNIDKFKSIRDNINMKRKELNAIEKLSSIQEQIRTEKFEEKKRNKKEDSARLKELKKQILEDQRKLDKLKREIDLKTNNKITYYTKRTFGVLGEVAQLIRTIWTTGEFSGVRRQGGILAAGHPVIALMATKESLAKGTFSEELAQDLYNNILESDVIKKHTGFEYDGKTREIEFSEPGSLTSGEEYFAGNLSQKLKNVPILGSIVKGSERQMSSFLNALRYGVFSEAMKANPKMTPSDKAKLITHINYATGRGNLGKFKSVEKELSSVFFSTRFMVSRFQVIGNSTDMLLNGKSKRVQFEGFKNLVSHLAGGYLLWAGLKLMFDDTEDPVFNPLDPEFFKIKIGNRRLDPLSGMLQVYRLIARTLYVVYAESPFGPDEKTEVDLVKEYTNFIKYKLAPIITVPLQFFTNKKMTNQETTKLETLITSFTQLYANDAIKMITDKKGLELEDIPFLFFGFFGDNFSEYDSDEKRSKKDDEIM